MSNLKTTLRCLLFLIAFVAPILGAHISIPSQQLTLEQLEAKRSCLRIQERKVIAAVCSG